MSRGIRTEEIKPNRDPDSVDKMLFLLPSCDLEIVRREDGRPVMTERGNWLLRGTTDIGFWVAKEQGYVEFA